MIAQQYKMKEKKTTFTQWETPVDNPVVHLYRKKIVAGTVFSYQMCLKLLQSYTL